MMYDNNLFLPFSSLPIIMLAIKAILHVLFASAIAQDAGRLTKMNRAPFFVSGVTWAFATLVGGVMVAGLYWLMHHSTLARGRT